MSDGVTPRTKAIIAIDYAGQPADWDALRGIPNEHGLVVADGCHAWSDRQRSIGQNTCRRDDLLLPPVKHITKGGMIVTNNSDWTDRCVDSEIME